MRAQGRAKPDIDSRTPAAWPASAARNVRARHSRKTLREGWEIQDPRPPQTWDNLIESPRSGSSHSTAGNALTGWGRPPVGHPPPESVKNRFDAGHRRAAGTSVSAVPSDPVRTQAVGGGMEISCSSRLSNELGKRQEGGEELNFPLRGNHTPPPATRCRSGKFGNV